MNGALLLTLDRRQCPGWAFDERYLAAAKATLISVDPLNPAKPAAIVSSNLSLANGIVGLDDGRLIVAETRGGRLRIVGTAGPPTTWLTPGSPDNLTRTSKGAIIAAVQPNLIAFGRYRFGHANRVASRIVGSNTAGSPWTLLYEDPTGQQVSGATSALLIDGVLIAGSVRADGLLVCKAGGL